MPWLNIDVPTKTATVHADTCGHMCGRTKREGDGGWQRFETVEDAKGYRTYAVKECGHCLRGNRV